MSSWFSRATERLGWLLARGGLAFAAAVALTAGSAVTHSPAQAEEKKAIVKIVSVGTRLLGGRPVKEDGYTGTGFIVYSAEERGGAQTVIMTADHVLGYTETRAVLPGMTFESTTRDDPPIWVKRGHDECRSDVKLRSGSDEKLKVEKDIPAAEEPCRRIVVYYRNKSGNWEEYPSPHIHRLGYKNQDFAVLWVKFQHEDRVPLKIGNTYDLFAKPSDGGLPVEAWGVDADQPDADAYSTVLTYRRRDQGPTLVFQTPVQHGNSGGPILFDRKVIGIVSAITKKDTHATRIQVVYDALRNWAIPEVEAHSSATIANARKALFSDDFGTAQRLLTEIWARPDGADELPWDRRKEKLLAARLLAKLHIEKLDNAEAAVEWLKKLAEWNDSRARVEIALLANKGVGNPDVRALREPTEAKPAPQASMGEALARLIQDDATSEEAIMACIFEKMDYEDKEPSCSSLRSKVLRRYLTWLTPGEKKSAQAVKEALPLKDALPKIFSSMFDYESYDNREMAKIDKFKKSNHILLPLLMGGRALYYGITRDDAQNSKTLWSVTDYGGIQRAALSGSMPAALQVFSVGLISKKDLDAVAQVVEKADYLDDKIYVVSERFFRIVDNRLTRQDFVRAKALAALAHLLGETDVGESEQTRRASALAADIDRLLRLDGGRSTPYPHRLISLVKALLLERKGENPEAVTFIRKALIEWEKSRYLPPFAADQDVLAHALRIIGNVEASDWAWLALHLREACESGPRCWVPLADHFGTLAPKLKQENVVAIADVFTDTVGKDTGLIALDSLSAGAQSKVAALAALLTKSLQEAGVTYGRHAVLKKIEGLLGLKIAKSPCPAESCKVRAWKTVTAEPGHLDWQVFEGRTDAGATAACRASTGKGQFARLQGRDKGHPVLKVSSFGRDLSRRSLEFATGVKVNLQGGAAGSLFIVGDEQFPASLREEGGKGVLYIDGTSLDLPRLIAAMAADQSLTAIYRGEKGILREHVSLQGFGAAYATLAKLCHAPAAPPPATGAKK